MNLGKSIFCAPAMLALLLSASAPSKAQTLRVGAARIDITPAADPANPPSGKYAHERLYLRAIVLDNGAARTALVGADQGMLMENIWAAAAKQIAAELNCPVENIMLSVTHTHSAWGPGDTLPATRPNGASAYPRPQRTATAHRRPDTRRRKTSQGQAPARARRLRHRPVLPQREP